jgi:hypothetical protein
MTTLRSNAPRAIGRNPKAKDYISDAGQLNLTRLVDDAVAVLEDIHYNGVGEQRRRSRGRYAGKVLQILEDHGYARIEALRIWNEQIIAMAELNINASE